MKRKRVNIGSVSHGTMRAEDLIPSFIWELKQQTPTRRAHLKLIREIEARIAADTSDAPTYIEDEPVLDYFDTDDAAEDLTELFDALNEYAPAYFYFGAHPGDGSDYGYWLSEYLNDDFDGLQVEDLTEVPSDYYGEILLVNDHGNTSLYVRARNGRVREIWAIV